MFYQLICFLSIFSERVKNTHREKDRQLPFVITLQEEGDTDLTTEACTKITWGKVVHIWREKGSQEWKRWLSPKGKGKETKKRFLPLFFSYIWRAYIFLSRGEGRLWFYVYTLKCASNMKGRESEEHPSIDLSPLRVISIYRERCTLMRERSLSLPLTVVVFLFSWRQEVKGWMKSDNVSTGRPTDWKR